MTENQTQTFIPAPAGSWLMAYSEDDGAILGRLLGWRLDPDREEDEVEYDAPATGRPVYLDVTAEVWRGEGLSTYGWGAHLDVMGSGDDIVGAAILWGPVSDDDARRQMDAWWEALEADLPRRHAARAAWAAERAARAGGGRP